MTARFAVGERVRVDDRYPPGHIRTPWYIRGKSGVVADMVGAFADPEDLARGGDGLPERPLYRVRFRQTVAWADYKQESEVCNKFQRTFVEFVCNRLRIFCSN